MQSPREVGKCRVIGRKAFAVTLFSLSAGTLYFAQNLQNVASTWLFPIPNNEELPVDVNPTKYLRLNKEVPPTDLYPKAYPHYACGWNCDLSKAMCRPRTYEEWQKLLSENNFQYPPLLQHGEFMFSWEKSYMEFPDFTENRTLPDLIHSTVTMADSDATGSVNCHVGQRLLGRVDLRDGYGRPRGAGLDEIRAWLVEDAPKHQRRAVVQVSHLGNGSYSLALTCLWPNSTVKLNVAVSYPREYIRAAIKQVRQGSTKYSVALFESNANVTEVTACSPTKNLPSWGCLCNYTDFNSREFYCGRPRDKRLTCSDLKSTRPLAMPKPYGVTAAERSLILGIPGSFQERTLKTKISIKTTRDGKLRPLAKCSDISPAATWDMTSRPQGFWDTDKTWRSLICVVRRFRPADAQSCLRGTHIYVIGDSNGHRLVRIIRGLIHTEDLSPWSWPNTSISVNRKWNIKVEFQATEYPLFLRGEWTPLLRSGSLERRLDAIPSRGHYLVVFHYYLHMTPFHLSVVRSRLEAAAQAVSRLLARNPEVHVAIRGPHVSSREWDWNHAIGGDTLGPMYLDLIQQTFWELRKRVLFLDGWGMTIAMENEDFHPENRVPRDMVHFLLSFICPS